VHVCPFGGWQRDFPDAQSVIDPLFSGANITRTGNNNWSQLDVPQINASIEEAKGLTDPTARARAWGELDRRITRSRRPSPSSGRGPRSRARRTWPAWCPRSATGT
jgi:ABC-type oligopeptide transport system substrate-binding subunit